MVWQTKHRPAAAQDLEIYQQMRVKAAAAFTRRNDVAGLWRALSRATDALLRTHALPPHTALLAVGGYGRSELFPFSDVDVLILQESQTRQAADAIIKVLQHLWDMGIPVSHAVRTVDETIAAAAVDHTICAALLDARCLAGDRAVYRALDRRFRREIWGAHPRNFVETKLAERDVRHEKWVDSRFVLEPHLKEGKGGLRDLQTLYWISRYCYGKLARNERIHPSLLDATARKHYANAYLFFSTIRAHLHLMRGRADERVSFDMQLELAPRLQFRGSTAQARAERFMQRYFQYTRKTGELTRVLCAALEEEHLRNPPALELYAAHVRDLPDYLCITRGRLNFSEMADLSRHPQHILDLFAVAQQRQLDIHPKAQAVLSRTVAHHGLELVRDKGAQKQFLSILLHKSPEITLRRMNEMGVLAAVIPEFSGISGQMQYDGYHTFTVDEHTLVAVGNLAAVEAGLWAKDFPLSTQVAKELNDRAVLYVAMLCHDIAKGQGGGHADRGQAITHAIALRLGLSSAQAETAAWLVAHHLLLSETAFKRDLDDPKTIADFVNIVQSPERLRLLLLITVADIKAVGPSIWNGWKGALMRELYQRCARQMGIDSLRIPQDLSSADETLLTQWRSDPSRPALTITADEFRAVTHIRCCVRNQPHLFRVLAGVFAWIGASIVSARITVYADDAALAAIAIQDVHGRAFAEAARLTKLPQLLQEGLAGDLAFNEELPRRRHVSRGREVAIEPAIFVDNQVSNECTVIEVNARDRLGLLYDLLGAFQACELTVVTAHIATYGQKAVDVFYVKNAYGHKLEHPAKLAQVEQRLMEYVGR